MAELESDPRVIAALIGAVLSVTLAVFNYFANRKNTKEIEEFKSEISRRETVHDARLDYEYEARKRLYHECEPVFFQLNEAAQDTIHRVISLARTSRGGHLGLKEGGWLSSEGYYSISTYYNLLASAAYYKIIKKSLTVVDLNVDQIIHARYDLLKQVYFTWTEDFGLAKYEPKLDYHPNVSDWRHFRENEPMKYWRQALPLGRLDQAVEALITHESEDFSRVMSFGEFEEAYRTKGSPVAESMTLVSDIFHGFDPRTRPILWRLLLTQALLCKAIVKACSESTEIEMETFKPIEPFSADEMKNYDWREDDDELLDEVVERELSLAFTYLYDQLPHLCQCTK